MKSGYECEACKDFKRMYREAMDTGARLLAERDRLRAALDVARAGLNSYACCYFSDGTENPRCALDQPGKIEPCWKLMHGACAALTEINAILAGDDTQREEVGDV